MLNSRQRRHELYMKMRREKKLYKKEYARHKDRIVNYKYPVAIIWKFREYYLNGLRLI